MNENPGEKVFVPVARVDELPRGTGKQVVVEEREIALFNWDGQFYATGDICPHRGAPLAEGFLEAGKVFCPWHCFDFDLQTGTCGMVPSLSVPTYEVRVEGDQVLVAAER